MREQLEKRLHLPTQSQELGVWRRSVFNFPGSTILIYLQSSIPFKQVGTVRDNLHDKTRGYNRRHFRACESWKMLW